MQRHILATALVLLMTALFVAPVQAAGPAAPEADVAILGGCSGSVAGAATCTFSCTEGNRITANFFGSGSVTATCGGGAATCTTPTANVRCAQVGSKAVVGSTLGVCSATGIGFFTCGG